MTGPKIAIWDIETGPHMVYTWGLFKQNIGLSQIVRHGGILSLCYKWLGDPKVHYFDCRKDPLDDSAVCAAAWELMDTADILVGQNSKHFDTRKINARLVEYGFPPPSPFKQIDTKVEASKLSMFTSNKLEWLGPVVGGVPKDKHNEFPGFELWAEVLKGNPKAWAAMRKYNPQDVHATEALYLKLRPWMEGHPNVAAYSDSVEPQCPACGSTDLQHRGYAYTQVGKYARLNCNHCGKWSRSRYTENTLAKRQSLLSN